MSIMIDTNVLSYAIDALTSTRSRERQRQSMLDASRLALMGADRVRVSCVTWFEIRRGQAAKHEALLTHLERSRLKILGLTGPMSARAAAMLSARNRDESLCRRCLNAKQRAACATCGAMIPKQQRIADALIVATAELTREVTVLLSYDGGVLDFAGMARGVEIRRPEHPVGPLFGHADQMGVDMP